MDDALNEICLFAGFLGGDTFQQIYSESVGMWERGQGESTFLDFLIENLSRFVKSECGIGGL